MRALLGMLLTVAPALAFAQVYPPTAPRPPVVVGASPQGALTSCPSNGAGPNPFANCGFETGDFSSWETVSLPQMFLPLAVVPAGFDPGFGLFLSAPTQGTLAATHGFDGASAPIANGRAALPSIVIAQDVALPAGTSSVVFDYRIGWDMLNYPGSTLPRVFRVEIQPSGGGSALQSTTLLTAAPGTTNRDTGPLVGNVDVTAFAGTAVRVAFVSEIPENFTGPAFFQLDNVRTEFTAVENVAVPSLNGYALAVLGLVLGLFGFVAVRRQA